MARENLVVQLGAMETPFTMQEKNEIIVDHPSEKVGETSKCSFLQRNILLKYFSIFILSLPFSFLYIQGKWGGSMTLETTLTFWWGQILYMVVCLTFSLASDIVYTDVSVKIKAEKKSPFNYFSNNLLHSSNKH